MSPDDSGAGKALTAALCPFCDHQLDIEMFNGSYGCDSGCDYVRFEVECPGCKRSIYETGTFGDYMNDADEAEYREEFMAEFAAEVQKINAAKAAAVSGEAEKK